ncbi:hypothetical protein J1605_018607 [Eschrichtius robustus]|uniref:Testican-2 n=1 Tax=Eschrichtius robustus TaxID=9764 RepID=A0AB34HW44_ESCRO|nr:hypothetical protein J1605_018607 [Eschrichtius robustus]
MLLRPDPQEVEDDYIKSWEDNQQGDEALDTTKDPCQKVKCSRHKVCIAQGYQRAMCISRKKLEHRIKQPALKLHGNKDTMCKPCHMAHLASVCGSDGHTYSSVVRSPGPSAAVGPDALVGAFSVADHSRGTKPGSLSQALPLTWAGAGGGWGLEEAGNCKSEGKVDVAAVVGWRVPLAVPPSPSPTFLFVQCKLEQQACLSSKQLTVRCDGPCPCPTEQAATSSTDGKPETCTGQDLADLGDRLRDWFQLLHENSKQNGSAGSGARPARGLDKSLGASCKDSIGWMFSKLDTSADLFLDQTELAAVNLDKYEVCIRPFFNSCDTYKDGRVSTAEWCFCFWREKPPCLAELERIQIQEAAKKKPGVFIPSCDEDGYYRKMQCDQSGGDCWCVDQLGLELTGTRMHGSPDCDDIVGFSGDFGSGVGWEDEEEKETEEAGEEAEEEGEAGEADDGGYIW